MFTFTSDNQKSHRTFLTVEDCVQAIAEWLTICVVNNSFPTVAMVRLTKEEVAARRGRILANPANPG